MTAVLPSWLFLMLLVATCLGLLTLGGIALLLWRQRPQVQEAAHELQRREVSSQMQALREETVTKLDALRHQVLAEAMQTRQELALRLAELKPALVQTLSDWQHGQGQRLELLLKHELTTTRQESVGAARQGRDELAQNLAEIRGQLSRDAAAARQESGVSIGELRQTVAQQLRQLQEDNGVKLEEMRRTVAEKLEGTLERRLGESFKMVSDRLEVVHKGLGEMQTLAVGVGDLKKVLTNVKTRGIWGEVQLGNLLEQILTPAQYECNVQTKSASNGRVEFALKLPGSGAGPTSTVWLPIDAKFPMESYERLLEAQERADPEAAEQAGRLLEVFIKSSAKDIAEKYIGPPETTDFAVMYLPTEGLFAEVARRPGVADCIQRDHRVIIAGPTTLAALLNSLQMGFRTLAIQKRSSEVWGVLGAVKTEFAKFGDVLDLVQKKLTEAGNVIDKANTRRRVLTNKLAKVQELPAAEAASTLGLVAELATFDGELESDAPGPL